MFRLELQQMYESVNSITIPGHLTKRFVCVCVCMCVCVWGGGGGGGTDSIEQGEIKIFF